MVKLEQNVNRLQEEKEDLKVQNERKDRELQQLMGTISSLKDNFERQLNGMSLERKTYNDNIALLKTKNDELQSKYSQKTTEAEQFQQKYTLENK